MMSRVLLVTLAAIAIGACGGAVEQPVDGTVPPISTLASSQSQLPPFGTWELVSLERTGRSLATDVHDVLQMDLRADGTVTVRRCGKTYYEPGSVAVRCADASSYDCFYGSVYQVDESWRIDVPDLPGTAHEQRGLVEYEGEGISVRYIMPTSPSGHFIRVPDAEKQSSTASGAVGNCKGS